MKKNLYILIKKEKKEFDRYYFSLLKSNLPKSHLSKVMIYGAFNGGKRIRPFLVKTFSKLSNIPKKNYMRLAAAIESIHSYSLMHDDLPSMDNDDYRRGKLSTHKKFDEAQAILAGDSLHDIAFQILSNYKTHKDPKIRIKLIENLSIILGSEGLAGGQSLDLLFENKNPTKKKILEMYELKTSALFSFCCSSAFIMGKKNKSEIKFANDYGKVFGKVFQIIDDYLDEVGNFNKFGKTIGKDKKQGKSTILKFLKDEEVLNYCTELISDFKTKNKKFFNKWNYLEELLNQIKLRKF